MKKLIPMTDYVLEEHEKYMNREDAYGDEKQSIAFNVIKYARLLKRPLNLGMFIPCDEDGNILNGKPLSPAPDEDWDRWEAGKEKYKEAKDRVLFKGFSVTSIRGYIVRLKCEKEKIRYCLKSKEFFIYEIIEDLTHLNLELC